MNERHRQPAHRLHYIDYAISAIETQLRQFNDQVKGTAAAEPTLY